MATATYQHSILVVDDEPTVLQLCERILKRAGYRVLTAGSGATAVQVCQKAIVPVDLAIIDCVMPEMNGPQVAKALNELNPRTVIMLMSGFPRNDLPRLLGHQTPQEYCFMEKPFLPGQLENAIAEALTPPAVKKAKVR
jgi:two-component system, cell cycle sensor histidine kinase and response regulator CckA